MSAPSEQDVTETSMEVKAVLPTAVERILRHELHHLRSHWWWLVLLGALLVVCGTLALVFPFIYSLIAISFLSVVLLVAGVATLVGAFWTGKWSGFLVNLLVGILYIAAGFVISEKPIESLLVVTIYVAVLFMVMGIFRALAAMMIKFPQWGWTLLNGVITFLVGLTIYRHLPGDEVWVIGLLIGLEMLFAGWAWIMLGLAIRRLPKLPASAA